MQPRLQDHKITALLVRTRFVKVFVSQNLGHPFCHWPISMLKYSKQHAKCFTVYVHKEYCVFRIESVDVYTDTIIKPETGRLKMCVPHFEQNQYIFVVNSTIIIELTTFKVKLNLWYER